MEKNIREAAEAKTRELINAPTCSSEAKEAAQRWLGALGTENERTETESYIKELEEDIMPIDNLIAFAGSDAGKGYFGADTAAGIVAHAKDIKAAGGKYCDCPACLAVKDLLDMKDEMLK